MRTAKTADEFNRIILIVLFSLFSKSIHSTATKNHFQMIDPDLISLI
jgi:hypothetical protein